MPPRIPNPNFTFLGPIEMIHLGLVEEYEEALKTKQPPNDLELDKQLREKKKPGAARKID